MAEQHNNTSTQNQSIRVGTDLVSVERIANSVQKEAFVKKVFHPNEIQYCRAKAHPASSFAARFAAKEAFFKALGTGLYTAGMGPLDVWIENDESGRPQLILSSEATQRLQSIGSSPRWDVSLSHDAQMAIATVILAFAAHPA